MIQVADAIESFSKQMKGMEVATVYGGSAFGPQIQALNVARLWLLVRQVD